MSKNCNTDIVKMFVVQPDTTGVIGLDIFKSDTFVMSGITALNYFNTDKITISGLTANIYPNNYYLSGQTFNQNTSNLISVLSNGNVITTSLSGLSNDTFITGFTYDNTNNLQLVRNDGVVLNTNISIMSGLTINGDLDVIGHTNLNTLSAITISATTFYGDGSKLSGVVSDNFYTSGATLINNILYFDRNDTLSAYTVSLSGFSTSDIYVSGTSFNSSTNILTLSRNDGFNISENLSSLANDIYVLSGIYDPSSGIVTYTNNSGNTFDVSGFTTGMTDSYTTNARINGTSIIFDSNIQGVNFYNVDLLPLLSGKTDLTLFNLHTGDTTIHHTLGELDNRYVNITGDTINGDLNIIGDVTLNTLSAITISATTFYGDGSNLTGVVSENYYTSGATLIGDTVYFDRNDTLSAYTLDLSSLSNSNDIYVTGGTYDNLTNTITLSRSDGNIVTITGITSNSGTTLTDSGTRIVGARARNNNNSLFLRYEDGVPYNINPYRLYKDLTINTVVSSGRDIDTWAGLILTGTNPTTDIIYVSNLNSERVNYSNNVNISINSGTTIYLYMSGSSISYPKIEVYLS